eukprot:COSAG01_NODE_45798_length_406_cov_0.755700_1_plen_54_part_01
MRSIAYVLADEVQLAVRVMATAVHVRVRHVLRETVLKYSSYWSTASPQLHGPKA